MNSRMFGRLKDLADTSGHASSSRARSDLEAFEDLVTAADAARDARDWQTAATKYQAAVNLRPEALGIGVQLGHALKESGRYAEAEACYRAFLAENPQDADIHLQMGHLFLLQDRSQEARPWYELAAALAPPASNMAADAARGLEACANAPVLAIRRRALALTDRRRYAEAYELLVSLVSQHGCEDLTGILGNVCKETGDYEAAEVYYSRYEKLAQDTRPDLMFDAAVQHGHFAKVRRRYDDAIGYFMRAKEFIASAREPSCSIRDLEGEIRTCLGQITKAIELR